MNSSQTRAERFVEVLGKRMAYLETGEGFPIVFIHGNPLSSYTWRNILPLIAPYGRCIAPDLIGMGSSEKLGGDDPARYSFLEHRRFLDALLERLGVRSDVVLVGQDWGGALAMDWARRNPAATRGMAYFESFVLPLMSDPKIRAFFEFMRSSQAERLVLDENFFIEKVLISQLERPLSAADLASFREPFLCAGEDRRPTLMWPREFPIDGTPEYMLRIIADYSNAMANVDFPKLFIKGNPGALLTNAAVELCRSWKNQTEVAVRGKHFLQEDAPQEVAAALSRWLGQLHRDPAGLKNSVN